MKAIAVVAGGVFRDSIRDRIAYGLVFFAVLLIAASFLLAQLTAGQDVKIIKDLGLAASLLFGVGIAIFIGIQLVAREVERRSERAECEHGKDSDDQIDQGVLPKKVTSGRIVVRPGGTLSRDSARGGLLCAKFRSGGAPCRVQCV